MEDQPGGQPRLDGEGFLSANFARRHAYHRMNPTGEIDLAEIEPLSHYSPELSSAMPTTRGNDASVPSSASNGGVNPSWDDHVPPKAGRDGEPSPYVPTVIVSPLSPPGGEEPQLPEAGVAPPTQAPQEPRKTRFREMLMRSLSSSREKYASGAEADTIRDVSGVSNARTSVLYAIPEQQSSSEEVGGSAKRHSAMPLHCSSRRDVFVRRRSWLYITLMVLSVYSTALSGIWLVVSILQPRYGRGISSSAKGTQKLEPATASLLAALFAKTTELSFVTVFVAFVGQVLTRRAFAQGSKGTSLAEMTMRNWVIQPGSLFTMAKGVPQAAGSLLGTLTLLATIGSIFYTTASDAMVSPKLKFGDWESKVLQGRVVASYANPFFIKEKCTTPISFGLDPINAAPSCNDVEYSGQSYRNLLAFMKTWQDIANNSEPRSAMSERPVGTAILYDNTTMYATWIDTDHGDIAKNFAAHKRIVNNVTLAMPHPGVYAAATDPQNDILQPSDLSDVGEYQIRASVVSPVVNTMCVNVARSELAPLVYTTWPHARNVKTYVQDQLKGNDTWEADVPAPANTEWLNRTVVDDIFRWGPQYRRRPPVFQLVSGWYPGFCILRPLERLC